jgi:uracil-DNA glycosylase family 4
VAAVTDGPWPETPAAFPDAAEGTSLYEPVRSSTVLSGDAPSAAPQRASVPELTRADELRAFGDVVAGCTKCALAGGRTQVVFGSGNPDSDLMFVGEAPGFHEDKQGVPFVGAAGKLLDQLLADIGLTRDDVYVVNVLKCRPPGNRDPLPDEIEACEGHLWRQIELIQPRVVATLGNFATKLLSGKPTGITRVHGQEQEVTLGGRRVLLYPIFHPAAALYTPRMLDVLKSDFARLPELMGREVEPPKPVFVARVAAEPAVQLGLF